LLELGRGSGAEARGGSGVRFLRKNRCISHIYYCMVILS
jgi:hypothetical protein